MGHWKPNGRKGVLRCNCPSFCLLHSTNFVNPQFFSIISFSVFIYLSIHIYIFCFLSLSQFPIFLKRFVFPLCLSLFIYIYIYIEHSLYLSMFDYRSYISYIYIYFFFSLSLSLSCPLIFHSPPFFFPSLSFLSLHFLHNVSIYGSLNVSCVSPYFVFCCFFFLSLSLSLKFSSFFVCSSRYLPLLLSSLSLSISLFSLYLSVFFGVFCLPFCANVFIVLICQGHFLQLSWCYIKILLRVSARYLGKIIPLELSQKMFLLLWEWMFLVATLLCWRFVNNEHSKFVRLSPCISRYGWTPSPPMRLILAGNPNLGVRKSPFLSHLAIWLRVGFCFPPKMGFGPRSLKFEKA